ncbi:hypothetical protein DINM_006312 [Dirofilaria immitis]|nr:hypothetical protein [Dirofilaria immitis]
MGLNELGWIDDRWMSIVDGETFANTSMNSMSLNQALCTLNHENDIYASFRIRFLWASVIPQSMEKSNQIEIPIMELNRYKRWTRLEPSVRFFDKRWTRLEPSVRFLISDEADCRQMHSSLVTKLYNNNNKGRYL